MVQEDGCPLDLSVWRNRNITGEEDYSNSFDSSLEDADILYQTISKTKQSTTYNIFTGPVDCRDM
jgi:hypothetical protein